MSENSIEEFMRYENSISVAYVPRPQNVIVYLNPPTFFWPPSGNYDDHYIFQLSRSKKFNDASTLTVKELTTTFYRPSCFLSHGKWYWRYKPESGVFSDIYEFYIGKETVKDESINTFLSFDEAIKRIPKTHPRLWIFKEDLRQIRKETIRNIRSRRILKIWEDLAKKYIGKPLREDVPLEHKIHENEDPIYQMKKWRKWDAIKLARETVEPAGSLAALFLITANKEYAEEAKRRALHAAKWDPEGFTSHEVSDFANQIIAENLAIVYDYLHDYLAKDELSVIKRAIVSRARKIYNAYLSEFRVLEKIFNSHAWQRVLQGLGICSLALVGEVNEAKEWLEYFLKLYLWIYPPWGDVDGGWAQGNGYFESMVMFSALTTADMIRKATGIDLYKKPWYKNMPYFLIYTHPPRTYHPNFGDGHPGLPTRRHSVVMRKLAQELNNPYAMWYAEEVEKSGGTISNARASMWESFFEYLWSLNDSYMSKAPADLPPSKLFRGIGWVLMHTNLAEPENDLIFAFKCSPYGSARHSHADQNSFSIIAYGKPLVLDSGYYIAHADRHATGWYVQTKAHNTILVDGMGQKVSKKGKLGTGSFEGYGTIEKFFSSRDYDYAVGNATNAYVDEAGLKKFKRHVLFLRPDIYVIFDELEADHEATWEWLLHSKNRMRIAEESNEIYLNEETARLKASITCWSSEKLMFNLTDQFDVPPINWHGRKFGGKTPPNQWHLKVKPWNKSKEEYFLAVLYPFRKNKGEKLPKIKWIKTDGYYGFTVTKEDWKETVIFDINRMGIEFDGLETDSFMLAFGLKEERLKKFMISNGTQVKYRGRVVFSSHKPVCASISL